MKMQTTNLEIGKFDEPPARIVYPFWLALLLIIRCLELGRAKVAFITLT